MKPQLAALLLTGALLAACSSGNKSSGPPVASISSSGGASAATGAPKASALAYARCMRAHGVKDFPDPDASGNLRLDASPGSDLDPHNPTFTAADAACKSLMPPPAAPPKDLKAQNLKYAKCMRQHGISDFPDPKPDGTLQIQATPGSDLDPNNPQFKSANDACKQYQPGGGAGGSLDTGGGS